MSLDSGKAIRIKRLSTKAILPTKGSRLVAGHEIYAINDFTIPAQGQVLAETGNAIGNASPQLWSQYSLTASQQIILTPCCMNPVPQLAQEILSTLTSPCTTSLLEAADISRNCTSPIGILEEQLYVNRTKILTSKHWAYPKYSHILKVTQFFQVQYHTTRPRKCFFSLIL